MKSIKSKVSAISGKICSILGYSLGLLMAIVLIANIADGKPSNYSVGYDAFMYLLFFSISGFLICMGITAKRRLKRLKQYSGLISHSNITSLQRIAASTNQSIDFVTNDLQKMIDRQYLKNVIIDIGLGEIVFIPKTTMQGSMNNPNVISTKTKNIKCPGCGANNTVLTGQNGVCEYCGSPIEI